MNKSVTAIAVLAAVLLSGCRKEYSCHCTLTVEVREDSSSPWITFIGKSDKSYSAKMTGKQAKSACQHEEETLLSTENNDAGGRPVPSDPNSRSSAECVLK